jgi:hypothetical protein
MRDLERILEKMQVPANEDEQFEYKLRRELLHKSANGYRFKFKVALVFSCLMLIFGCTTIIKPDIALKLNNLAFQRTEKIVDSNDDCAELENLAYTSIYNPNLSEKIDPDKFQEDKTYLVRKYTSTEEGGLMIVSEFDKNPKNNLRKE